MIVMLVFAYVAAAWVIAILGRDRRFGFWGYFFASLLLTPIIGLLLYLATDGPARQRPIVARPK
jgi:hypothetical protein